MLFRLLFILAVMFAFTALPGCKKTTEPTVQPTVQQQPKAKITQENLDSELDKMEKEVQADVESGQ